MLGKVLYLSMYMSDIKQMYQSLHISVKEVEEDDVHAIERVLWHKHRGMPKEDWQKNDSLSWLS